jgi:threonine/homoserine/homoserine lactone efflux protein
VAGREAEADAFGEFGDGETPVVLQLGKDFPLLVLVPGADWAYAISAGLRDRTVLTSVGAGCLVWLGIATLARPSAPTADAEESAGSWLRRAAKGAGISGLNPKALLLFLALLPQFIAPGATWPIAAQIVLLGLVHTANCAAVYTGVGTAARLLLRARPAAARVVTRCSGAAMVVIGALLLAERVLG